MDDKELKKFYLTLHTTPETLAPAIVPYLQHKYKYGTQEEAIRIMNDIFDNALNTIGLQNVLSGNKLPIFDIGDIQDRKLTYAFERHEITDEAYEVIRKAVQDSQQ